MKSVKLDTVVVAARHLISSLVSLNIMVKMQIKSIMHMLDYVTCSGGGIYCNCHIICMLISQECDVNRGISN